MARIEPVELDGATAKARELLEEYATRGGEPGPMVRTMANAPALLRGYLDLSRAMKRSHLDRRITERIALAAQEWIGCEYCVAAHTAAAQKLASTTATSHWRSKARRPIPRSRRSSRSASR